MADVDMTDAPASAPVVKKKSGAGAEGDSKKPRFEVKKACHPCACHNPDSN